MMKAPNQNASRPPLALCPDPAVDAPAPRTNYIFIDYENVQPSDLTRINRDNFQLVVVVGKKQTSLKIEVTDFALAKPNQLRLVQTPCVGKNALDFVLACEVGRIIADDPRAYIHIISKDSGFDALVAHLKEKEHLAARHNKLDQIPLLLRTDERFNYLVAKLSDPTKSRPGKHKTLINTIQQYFAKTLTPETVDKTIRLLIKEKVLKICDQGKVTYTP